ncbi:MAG: efflux RND transporter periplasmic adaptor subunit [Oceanicoccus sp.]
MSLNYRKLLTPFLIVAVSIAIAIALFFNRPAPEQTISKERSLLINAARVVKQDIRISVRAQGTITPRTETTMIAEVSGRIMEVSDEFKAGGFFEEGDVLLKIDQRDYLAAVKRTQAAVASAESNLATERGRAEVAQQEQEKYKSRAKRSLAANDLALRKPQLADAKANLESALANLDNAKDQLDRTTIRAPYEGLVRSKQVDIGQYVNVGAALAKTFAVDFAELRMALPENKLNYMELPTLAERDIATQPLVDLYAEIGETLHQWQGHIVRTEGVFDERSRALFVVAEINDPYGLHNQHPEELRIGTFVDARIEGRLMKGLVVLPRYILRTGNQLWVIDDQSRLQNRKVTVLRTEGSDIYVTNGLNEGEIVSLSSIGTAVPGTKVDISTVSPTDQSTEDPTLPETPAGAVDLEPTEPVSAPIDSKEQVQEGHPT